MRPLAGHSSNSSRNVASRGLAVAGLSALPLPVLAIPIVRRLSESRQIRLVTCELVVGNRCESFRPALPRLAPHGPNDQCVPLRRDIHLFPQRTLLEQRRINWHQAGARNRNGLCIHGISMPRSGHRCKGWVQRARSGEQGVEGRKLRVPHFLLSLAREVCPYFTRLLSQYLLFRERPTETPKN